MTSSPSELQELAEAWQADQTKHPWTCNGGNGNFATHHDHEVRLVPGLTGFSCPECQRQQPYGEFEEKMLRGQY